MSVQLGLKRREQNAIKPVNVRVKNKEMAVRVRIHVSQGKGLLLPRKQTEVGC